MKTVYVIIGNRRIKMRYPIGLEKGIGLMFKRKPERLLFNFEMEGRAINTIHSFFVNFEFEAIFLDKNKKVVQITKVKPFSFVVPKAKVKYLIEAEPGFTKKYGIKKFEKINFLDL